MDHARHYFPEGYAPVLDLRQTQQAIKTLKDCFQQQLGALLNLTRVSAPLFVTQSSGLNDDLSGVERKVGFDMKDMPGEELQVVQSLAKWKRMALGRYQYPVGEGIYTDMNAIRRDEETDNLHSIYVDQWDWEKVIGREQRSLDYLKKTVRRIHSAVMEAEVVLHSRYPALQPRLPAEVYFITSGELEARYPDLTPQQREQAITRLHKAVFVMQIGGALKNGKPHGDRAPDYDDWSLNGDLLYFLPELDRALEVSSMGIRVDAASMYAQLETTHSLERLERPFHQMVYRDQLPLTIGGGIGQSRLCMLLLRKAHIGEVQCSIWPEEAQRLFDARGIMLL
jgi:aspartate--ammonia ligase